MEKYRDAGLSPGERARDLLSRMTLEEKVAQMDMIRGVELATKVHEAHFCAVDETSDFHWDKVEKSIGKRGMGFVHDVYSVPAVLNKLQRYLVEETRLGIPCIFTGEALHGLSWPGATVFPMPISLGAAFHPELTKEVGRAIAAETRSLGIHEILAPNLDLAREPRWGRVEETFGEDTYLSAQMAYAMITGEQGEEISAQDAVLAEPKHYCVHGIPEAGTNCSPARVGRREIETAYLPVFEAGIRKAGAYNAMASYNCIDGEAVICSEYYLREILKKRYGLKGYVRADFGAVSRLCHAHHMSRDNKESIEMAVNGGLDVQGFDFPNEVWQSGLIELVEEGRIAQETIDDAVFRILKTKFELGIFEHPYTDETRYKEVVRCQKHKDISYQAAVESLVLLQNKENLLPLSGKISSVAVIGPSSAVQQVGSYSSVPYGYTVSSLYEEIRKKVGPDCVVRQADGCTVTEHDADAIPKKWFENDILPEYDNSDHFDKEPVLTAEDKAVEAAKNSDVVILVCGDNKVTSGEGMDRWDLKLYGKQQELIRRVSALGKPMVLVLEIGKPVDLTDEAEHMDSILVAWFGGEFGAKAIADVLFGEVSPSGRLPVSFPKNVGCLPCYYSMLPGGSPLYLEGEKKERFAFGFGMSYTSFLYENLRVQKGEGPCDYRVLVTVTNSGQMAADEIVQLYVRDMHSSIVTPDRVLQGFQRISLKPRERREVVFELGFDSFKLLNRRYEWVVEKGEFEIMVGKSSREICLETMISIGENVYA